MPLSRRKSDTDQGYELILLDIYSFYIFSCSQFYGNITDLFLDDIIEPMKKMDINKSVYCLVKAVLFFDNGILHLKLL